MTSEREGEKGVCVALDEGKVQTWELNKRSNLGRGEARC